MQTYNPQLHYRFSPKLHQASLKSHIVPRISKEFRVTRVHQAKAVTHPLVISEVGYAPPANKTQTLLISAYDVTADLSSLFSQICLQPVAWDYRSFILAFRTVMIMTLVDLRIAK